MNEAFCTYVSSAKALVEQAGLRWSMPVNCDGSVEPEFAWNLTEITKSAGRTAHRLNNLGCDVQTLAVINQRRARTGSPAVPRSALPLHWQDLIKAAVARQMLVARNTPRHTLDQVARPLRVIATCVGALSDAPPWQLTPEDIRWTMEIATDVQKSGKLADLVGGVVRALLDARHLCDASPLWHRAARLGAVHRTVTGKTLLQSLQDRAHAEKLPEADALWELVDIVFTREPQTLSDVIRFAQLQVQILCGLRIGEVSSIPADWQRYRDYVSTEGRPAGEVGGVSRSLMLRHFAEKQRRPDQNSAELVEAFQHVPAEFEELIDAALTRAAEITLPLRERLRQQIETGRPFPEFERDDLVPLTDMYTRLTGNPILRVEGPPPELVAECRKSRDPSLMKQIQQHQERARGPFTNAYMVFWSRWQQNGAPRLRDFAGTPQGNARSRLARLCIRVGDVEDHLQRALPTKLSDIAPLLLAGGGELPASEFLFLMPKRALVEARNGLCDTSRYFAVGRATPDDLSLMLRRHGQGLFARYGQSEAARALSLESHSLRHMQNTVLFQTGISDAAITKRFNRRTVAQSYEYDQRTLAQQLAAIDLPPAAKGLPDRARTVAKMILAGKAKGTITDEFKRIQRERGDEEAFEFLAAEADGFHATPYGHCVNGFTQEPCPKHLQCTSGCNHFVNSDLDRNVANIRRLLEKTERALIEIRKRKGGAGWESQLRYAETHARNLRLMLETPEGEKPFADGEDLSQPIIARTALDV